MGFWRTLSTSVGIGIVIIQPSIVLSLIPQEIGEIAREITVLIDGQFPGTGIIIAHEKDVYYVLTAKHVVQSEDEYEIVTSDEKRHPLDYSLVEHIPDIDLAIIQFKSDRNYQVGKLGNSDTVTAGTQIYVYGFPNPGREIQKRVPQFTPGQVTSASYQARDGYQLVYNNVTREGMSGGPVLDLLGNVVGIHGRAEGEAEDPYDTSENSNKALPIGFNLGIPINTFIQAILDTALASKLNTVTKVATPSNSLQDIPIGVPSRPPVLNTPDTKPNNVCPGRVC